MVPKEGGLTLHCDRFMPLKPFEVGERLRHRKVGDDPAVFRFDACPRLGSETEAPELRGRIDTHGAVLGLSRCHLSCALRGDGRSVQNDETTIAKQRGIDEKQRWVLTEAVQFKRVEGHVRLQLRGVLPHAVRFLKR